VITYNLYTASSAIGSDGIGTFATSEQSTGRRMDATSMGPAVRGRAKQHPFQKALEIDRSKGVYPTDLETWKQDAMGGLGEPHETDISMLLVGISDAFGIGRWLALVSIFFVAICMRLDAVLRKLLRRPKL
jgi:hypothetical protein